MGTPDSRPQTLYRPPNAVTEFVTSITFSTLALSGGVACGVHQEAEEVGRRIGQLRGVGRRWRILVGPRGPQVSADGRERVAEGGFGLGVPRGLTRRETVGMRGVGHEDDHADEAEKARCGATDGAGGPLTLQTRPDDAGSPSLLILVAKCLNAWESQR